jgi:hypothetical protein
MGGRARCDVYLFVGPLAPVDRWVEGIVPALSALCNIIEVSDEFDDGRDGAYTYDRYSWSVHEWRLAPTCRERGGETVAVSAKNVNRQEKFHTAVLGAIFLDSGAETVVLLCGPAAFGDGGGHLCPPTFAAVLVGTVGDMGGDGVPLGRGVCSGVLCVSGRPQGFFFSSTTSTTTTTTRTYL